MPNNNLMTIGVVAIALIVAFAPQTMQKDSSAQPGTQQAALQQSAPRSTNAAPPPNNAAGQNQPNTELAFLSSDTIVITPDPKSDDDTLAGLSLRNTSKTKEYAPHGALTKFGFVSDSNGSEIKEELLSVEGIPKGEVPKEQPPQQPKPGQPKKGAPEKPLAPSEKPLAPLAPNDTVHVTLRWKKGSRVRPGNYDGFLIITADNKEIVRRAVQVAIQDLSGTVQPLISKLNIRMYREFPFLGGFFAAGDRFAPALPLQTPVNPNRAGLTRKPLLAVLTRDLAGTVPVSWDKKADSLQGNEPKLGLQIGPIPFSGKYDGSLNFGNDKTAVSVSLTTADLVIYPLLVLAAAIVIATKAKNFMGGGRQILQFRADLAAAGKAMEEARETFNNEVTGPAAQYSLQNDFDAQARIVLQDIAHIQSNFMGTLNTQDAFFVFVNTQIPALKAAAKNWVLFGSQLNALQQARATVPTFKPPGGIANPPGVDAEAAFLLKGRDVTLAEFDGLRTQVVNQTSFLAQWTGLAKTVDSIRNEVIARKIATLDKPIIDAYSALWQLTGQDTDKNKAASDTVNALSTTFAETLDTLMPPPPAPAAAPSDPAALGRRAMQAFSDPPTKTAWTSTSSSEAFLKEAIKRRDWSLGLLSFTLAVLTGLNTLYFGKTFGTVADYVALILWAFGSKITVDALSGGLEHFFGA